MQAQSLEPRGGTPSPRLSEQEFLARFLSQFPDPAFDPLRGELARVAAVAWDAYANQRKSPRTRKAGPGFADPAYDPAQDPPPREGGAGFCRPRLRPGRGRGRRPRRDRGGPDPPRRSSRPGARP